MVSYRTPPHMQPPLILELLPMVLLPLSISRHAIRRVRYCNTTFPVPVAATSPGWVINPLVRPARSAVKVHPKPDILTGTMPVMA